MIGKILLVTIVIATAAAFATPDARADTFTYQGSLTSGGVLVNDACDFQFILYDAQFFGAQIGPTVTRLNVSVTNGQFTVQLGFGADAFAVTGRWLRIDVRCPAGSGSYTTLTPRQPVTPAPNALALAAPSTTRGTVAGAATVRIENQSTLGSSIGVHGVMTPISGGGLSTGVRGENRSTTGSGIGVWGSQSGFGWGVYGTTDRGTGVFGRVSADAPSAIGVLGESVRTGVFGRATANAGFASGVFGESNSVNGRGLWGKATASTGLTFGVRGESASTDGRGVAGVATAQTGSAIGVKGTSFATDGTGVFGHAQGNGATIGVEGSANASGWDFFASGAAPNFGAASSIRWKSNIRNIDQPLEKIARLRGVYYDWDEEHGGHHGLGMIAEEVGAVLPEIVTYEENGIDASGMDYSKLTPLLVEAVNALRTEKDNQIASLRIEKNAEIKELRATNVALESRLTQIEAALAQLAAQQGNQQ